MPQGCQGQPIFRLPENSRTGVKKYISEKLSCRWHSSYYKFKRRYESSWIDAQRHDIEVKEVYLFSKMRFPPRSLYKSLKSKDRRMNTALTASIQ